MGMRPEATGMRSIPPENPSASFVACKVFEDGQRVGLAGRGSAIRSCTMCASCNAGRLLCNSRGLGWVRP